MPRFPAAYCYDCGRFLSPHGRRSDADRAGRAHETTRLKFEGVQHRVAVFDSRSDFDANGPEDAGVPA